MPTFQKAEFVLKCKNCVKQLTRIVNETSVNIKDIMKVAHLMEEMSGTYGDNPSLSKSVD